MKINKKSTSRHFPYKSPKFGTISKPANKSSWETTVYYWWWSYLKRNTDYVTCCESSGRGKLGQLYKDFGDVRSGDFKQWWTHKMGSETRGSFLFAEPSVEESVKTLQQGERAPSSKEALTVVFPLNFPKRFLERRFKTLLGVVHKGRRGVQLARNSKARYRIKGQPNIPSLAQGLMVYDALLEAKRLKLRKPYWQIAQELKLTPLETRVSKTDSKRLPQQRKMY